MHIKSQIISIFSLIATWCTIFAQLLPHSPDIILNELEHIYLDNSGPNSLKSTITPCTNYIDSTTGLNDNTLGRQSSAQWIRTAFHDFVTADVAAGTGGIDASIGFETHRPENVGVAFNDSLFIFAFFISAKVSMADLIALGTAMAIGTCGGPPIQLRGGRIDATEAGASGVCQPETDLQTTLASFSGAGFNPADTIALTACGHTMGGVHHSTFPQIVPASAVGPDNSGGRIAFDDTVAKNDIDVLVPPFRLCPNIRLTQPRVQEYLSGTGNRGGPLVTTANKTVQSDLRLYESDNNVTIQSLAQSPAHFASVCANLVARMLDTVPKTVSLTSAIDPRALRHANITLNVNWSGQMTLSGFFRVRDLPIDYIDIDGSPPPPTSMTVSLIDRNGLVTGSSTDAKGNLATDAGNGIYGPIYPYPFTLNFPATIGLSGIAVGGQKFPLQDSLFVVPTMSSIEPGLAQYNIEDPAHVFTINITAALLTSNPPTTLKATIAVPVPQPGNMSPRIDYSNTTELSLIGTAGPYAMYSTIFEPYWTSLQLFGASVDVEDESTGDVAMFFKLFNLLEFF
ncbi:heme peroxidase [Usnea florida]